MLEITGATRGTSKEKIYHELDSEFEETPIIFPILVQNISSFKTPFSPQ